MVISTESILYSLRNLKARKSRSLLTILSIFVGIASIFIFISFGLGLYNYVNDFATGGSADKVIIQTKGGGAPGLDDTFKLTNDDLKEIERVAGVYEATGSSFGVGEVQKGNEKKFVFVSSFDPKNLMMFDISQIEVVEGRILQSGETKKVLLGNNYRLDDKIFSRGLHINDVFDLQGEKVRVVGFMSAVGNPQDDSNIYITQDYFDELYPKKTDSYGWIIARVDIETIDKVVSDIERALRKSRDVEEGKEDFFVQSFEDAIASFQGALNIIIGFVILIALISVIVSAVNTANTMITSVLERTKEIGVLKSIGARNSEILKIFLFESAFLGAIAGSIGVFVGWIIAYLAGNLLDALGWGFLSPNYPPILFVGLVIFATLTGGLSGIIPAIRASKINAVDALRYE